MAKHNAVPAVLLTAISVIACADLPTGESREGTGTQAMSGQAPSLLGPINLSIFWDSSQVINIAVDGGLEQALIESRAASAAANWNSEVLTTFSALPRFGQVGDVTLTKPRILITFDDSEYSGSGNFGYCGATDPGTGTGQNKERGIDIWKKDDDDTCEGRIVDDVAGVIAHEFSEALGVESVGNDQTVWCVANVQDTGEILNKIPCAWEQQLVYAGYHLRLPVTGSPNFLNPILRSIYIQSDAAAYTIVPGDTVEFKAVALAGPEPSQPEPQDSSAIDVFSASWIGGHDGVFTIVRQTDSTIVVTAGTQTGDSYLFIEVSPHQDYVYPWPRDSILIVNPSDVNSDFCISDWTTTWRMTDQYLNAACGQTGTSIRYSWKLESGESWTEFTADTIMDFAGHTTAGTKVVSLKTKDLGSGAIDSMGKQIVVSDNRITMTGPDAITRKKVYTYTSSGSPCWFTRFPPDYAWRSLGACRDTITFIWSAGDYPAVMRSERASVHARARTNVEVCTTSQDCGEEEAAFGLGVPGAVTKALEGWGLFGLGPWMSSDFWGQGSLLRLYDLSGLHEPDSPFAHTEWLSQASGTLSTPGWTVAWEDLEDPWPDARLIRFETTGPLDEAHRFGLAIDPDLGVSAADDRSGYDSVRQLVYATDPAMVVGFMILSATGDRALSVRQFGAGNPAPLVTKDALNMHKVPGVQLDPGAGDVQFLIWKKPVEGMAEWVVVILRGKSLADVQALADEVMMKHRRDG